MGLQAVTIPSPRITWPKLPPVAVPPSLAPVVIGGLIGWGVGNLINPIVQPPLSTAVDWCMKNNTDDCDKEWEDALKMCKDLNKKNPWEHRPITGGYSDYACARGLVSERCGGNRVSK